MSTLRRMAGVWTVLFALVGQGCYPEGSSQSGASGGDPNCYTNFSSEFALDNCIVTESGSRTSMNLKFRTFKKPSKNYTVFVHAIDKDGSILFQFDHELKNAAGIPTSAWERGEVVEDAFALTPTRGHPPGKYTLRFGLYVPETKFCLPVTSTLLLQPNDGWRGMAALLSDIECR